MPSILTTILRKRTKCAFAFYDNFWTVGCNAADNPARREAEEASKQNDEPERKHLSNTPNYDRYCEQNRLKRVASL